MTDTTTIAGAQSDRSPAGEGGLPSPAAADWDRQLMYSPLSHMIRRPPVVCAPDLSVREVLECINLNKVGSMVVCDPQTRKPLGIFTLRDLLQRVSLAQFDLGRPVADVMTAKLVALPPQVSAYEAAVTMARNGLRHLLVIDGERLVGVVSQNDVLGSERQGARDVGAGIREAADVAALKQSAGEIRRLAQRMLRQGMGIEILTQMVSTLNDLLTLRVIELTRAEFSLPEMPICWIALGSEGRFEQTISTDQDNGMIFVPPAEERTEDMRAALLPFARAVNQALDACGFPLCKGDIMAGNPAWCLSLAEWRGKFFDWILRPEPAALLNAMIFFDFRALYGDESLAERLRAGLLESVAQSPAFLRHMTEDALSCRPPLGRIRDFTLDKGDKDSPRGIDLKKYGSRPFVDAARILALARGLTHTNTAQRLRMAGDHVRLGTDAIESILEGFFFIHRMRLRAQMNAGAPGGGANRLDPYTLNDMDRQMLKEAFKQARKLQAMLTASSQFSLSPERL